LRAALVVSGRKFSRRPPTTEAMIRLHRLGKPDEPIHVNPDLILMVEATPDTVVSLTVGTKILVAERPEEVVAAVRAWRASVLSVALGGRARLGRSTTLTLVRGTAGSPPVDPEDSR